jgi:undecaprenyl diphosphate synthase
MGDQKIPACVGIVLDGNRRWAKAKNLSTIEGHTKGLDNLELITRAAKEAGVGHLIVYAFSTENWNRSPEEVSGLMGLILTFAREHIERLITEGVRVKFIGERERLSREVRDAVQKIEHDSQAGKFILWVCLSYGGRAEIVEAAHKMQKSGEEITEKTFANNLWTAEMPDPDLIIRTGGAQRLSNFLLWQSAYSELFFTDTYWPDFSEAELNNILKDYQQRERRMGK